MKWKVKCRLQVPNFADPWSMVAIFDKQDVFFFYIPVSGLHLFLKIFLPFLFLILLAP
jgi:hypothetical protein